MVIVVSELRDGVVVIKLSGKLNFDPTLFTLRQKLKGLLEAGIRLFLFDLADVPHCDSSGCGEMIGAYTSICKADARIAFVHLTPKVRTLWDRINVTNIFPIFDTAVEAENFLRTGR